MRRRGHRLPHQHGRDVHEAVAGEVAGLRGQAAPRRARATRRTAGEHERAARGTFLRRLRLGRPSHTGLLAAGLGRLLAPVARRSRARIPPGAERPHLPPAAKILMARRQDPERHNSPFGGMPRAGGRGTLLHPLNGCLPDTYNAHSAENDCQCWPPLPPNTGVGDAMDTAMRRRRLRGVKASCAAALLCKPGPPRQGRIRDAGCASRFCRRHR